MRKKSVSLESKRPLLFAAGLLFAVSLTLVSFEWRTPYKSSSYVFKAKPHEFDGEWVLPVQLEEPEKQVEKPKLPEKLPELTNRFNENDIYTRSSDEFALGPDDLEEVTGDFKFPEEGDADDDPVPPTRFPSVNAEYCGGETAMFEFLSKELTYPEIPRTNGISGTVQVQFVVSKNGKIRDAKVVRPIDPWLDAEALRVAKMLECFTPGLQAGQPVDVYFVLPIRFALSR